MAISLVASAWKGSTDNQNVTTDAIDTSGANLLVHVVPWYNQAVEPTISDSKSNTWTQLTYAHETTCAVRIYYCLSPSVGSGHTFSALHTSGGDEYPDLHVMAFSGVDSYESQDRKDNIGGGAVKCTTGLTPINDGSLLIAGMCVYLSNSSAPTIDSSFTIMNSHVNNGHYFTTGSAYQIQTTATARNPTWTPSAAQTDGCAVMACFKASAGGGGSSIKTINGLALASVKTRNGLAIASMKTLNGLA